MNFLVSDFDHKFPEILCNTVIGSYHWAHMTKNDLSIVYLTKNAPKFPLPLSFWMVTHNDSTTAIKIR